jgi:hypothetical protein
VASPSALQTVVQWLRCGYPQGVPEQDHQPLLALLRRRLSEDEVHEVGELLVSAGDPATGETIRHAITDVLQAEPSDQDVARVRGHLAASGWPLAGLDVAG